jgi:hypothetical protein
MKCLEEEFPSTDLYESKGGQKGNKMVRAQDISEFQMLMESIVNRVRGHGSTGSHVPSQKKQQQGCSRAHDSHTHQGQAGNMAAATLTWSDDYIPANTSQYEIAPRLVGDHPDVDGHVLLQPSPKPLLTYSNISRQGSRSASNSPDREGRRGFPDVEQEEVATNHRGPMGHGANNRHSKDIKSGVVS